MTSTYLSHDTANATQSRAKTGTNLCAQITVLACHCAVGPSRVYHSSSAAPGQQQRSSLILYSFVTSYLSHIVLHLPYLLPTPKEVSCGRTFPTWRNSSHAITPASLCATSMGSGMYWMMAFNSGRRSLICWSRPPPSVICTVTLSRHAYPMVQAYAHHKRRPHP